MSRYLVTAPPTTPAPPGNGIRRGVSRPSTFLASRFLASPFGSGGRSGGSERSGRPGRPGSLVPCSLLIPKSSPPFSAHAIILRSFPSAPAVRRWPTYTPNASGAVLTTFSMFSTLTSARHATEISLERQFFYTPPAAADPKLASRGFRAQEREPSVTISRVLSHPPLPQDMHNPQSGNTGKSQADAILIRSDNEFDLNGRSNISFKSLDGLLPDARNKVQSGRITGVGICLDLAFLGRPIY